MGYKYVSKQGVFQRNDGKKINLIITSTIIWYEWQMVEKAINTIIALTKRTIFQMGDMLMLDIEIWKYFGDYWWTYV